MRAFNLIAKQPESSKTIGCKLLSQNLSQRRALPLGSYEKIIGSSQSCEASADGFEKIVTSRATFGRRSPARPPICSYSGAPARD
jgi:hypothetical protein